VGHTVATTSRTVHFGDGIVPYVKAKNRAKTYPAGPSRQLLAKRLRVALPVGVQFIYCSSL